MYVDLGRWPFLDREEAGGEALGAGFQGCVFRVVNIPALCDSLGRQCFLSFGQKQVNTL
jgi:hypothetical protein